MLAEINSLPGPEVQTAIGNRNRKAVSEYRSFDVGRHIVGPFASVNERRIFRAQLVGSSFHINANVRISIFVDRQTRRGVLDEDVHQAGTYLAQLWAGGDNISRNQMKAPFFGGQSDLILKPNCQNFS
jgi:hypothetical protein